MNLVKSFCQLSQSKCPKQEAYFHDPNSQTVQWFYEEFSSLYQVQMQNKSFSDRRIRAGRRVPTGDDGIVGPLRGPVSVLGPEFIPGLHILVGV